MADEEKNSLKAHCPECDGERTCDILGQVDRPWYWDDDHGNSMNGSVEHSLLECRGCETVFYQTSSWHSEDENSWQDARGEMQHGVNYEKRTYPKPDSKTKPIWFDTMSNIDGQLHDILNEMYVAYDNHAYILTAVGLRTALDRGTEVLGIDPARTFSEKLADLQSGGWIGATEHDILEVVTDAGNAAAHRGWSPQPQEVSQLIYAMEVFLQRAFIVGTKALKIKSSIPAKARRRQAVEDVNSSGETS